MTIYTKTTDFQAKDALASGNPLKIVKGTEIDDEFDAIATADATNLKKDGTVTVTANIPMGTYKLTGLGAGSAATDSANLGQVQAGAYQLIGSISGVDTITGSLTPAISAYDAGQKFSFIAAGANTGAATININGLGAKSITKLGTTALAAGDLPSGAVVEIEYDGMQFQLCNLVAVPLSAQIFNNLTTVTLDPAADYFAIADGSDSGNAKKALIPSSTTTASGLVELATDAETLTGTDTTRAVTPSNLGATRGIVKLNSGSVTAAATLDIVMTSYTAFKNKRIVLNNIAPATDGVNLTMRFSTNGGSSYDAGATDYNWAFSSILAPSTTNDTGSTGDTAIVIAINVGNASGESVCGNIELFNTNDAATSTRTIYDTHGFNSSGNGYRVYGAGARAANQDTDAVRFLFSSGNIALGAWTLYGWN